MASCPLLQQHLSSTKGPCQSRHERSGAISISAAEAPVQQHLATAEMGASQLHLGGNTAEIGARLCDAPSRGVASHARRPGRAAPRGTLYRTQGYPLPHPWVPFTGPRGTLYRTQGYPLPDPGVPFTGPRGTLQEGESLPTAKHQRPLTRDSRQQSANVASPPSPLSVPLPSHCQFPSLPFKGAKP